jgi:RNA polymerase sigma-70 factor (ECF subfamily)
VGFWSRFTHNGPPEGTSPRDPEWLQWERRCLERVRRGSKTAQAALYDAIAPMLLTRVILPALPDAAAAEDALAETFRAGFDALERFDDRGVSVWFWFARIAKNKALDERRRAGRAHRLATRLAELTQEPPEEPVSAREVEQERLALVERTRRALSRVTPRYRRAVELRILEERSRAECAAALEVTVATFDVVLLRALRALRSAMEEEDVEGSPKR